MPYLCKNCGNKRDFYEEGEEQGYCSISRRAKSYLNQHGDNVDFNGYGDTDYGDDNWDEYESFDEGVLCSGCDNEAEDVTDEEWEEWIEGKGEDEQKPKMEGKISMLKKELIG